MSVTCTDNGKLRAADLKAAVSDRWAEILSTLGGVDLQTLDGRPHEGEGAVGREEREGGRDEERPLVLLPAA